MRKEFKNIINKHFESNEELFLILGDIGVYGFEEIIKKYPERAINIGILEQSMVGTIAGFSKLGILPIVHSIAPFLVERAFEQVKLAVGYHDSNCRLVSIGASYDYINLGPTHHCPADIAILSTIPNLQIIIPASPSDFVTLFEESLTHKAPIYFRLTDNYCDYNGPVQYGKCRLLNESTNKSELILSIGPMLHTAELMAQKLGFTHINCTSLLPFDDEIFNKYLQKSGIIHVIEPFFEGSSFRSLFKLNVLHKLNFYGFSNKFQSLCGSYKTLIEKNNLDLNSLIERYYEQK